MTKDRDSIPGIRERRQLGFTLMEMVVVLAVLAISAVMVLPLLPESDAARLRGSSRSLATVIRYLGERSITTKTRYRMSLDLNEGSVSVKKLVNGDEAAPEDPFFSRNVLAEGVTIEDVEIERRGRLSEGTANVDFGVAGLGEFLLVHLKGAKGGRFTVTALPNGGRVEVLEGYREIGP